MYQGLNDFRYLARKRYGGRAFECELFVLVAMDHLSYSLDLLLTFSGKRLSGVQSRKDGNFSNVCLL